MMKSILSRFVAVSCLLVFLTPNIAISAQNRRIALVIGNANYTHGGNLANPVNDARAITKALENLGFTVLKHENCSQRAMKKAIDAFGRRLKSYDVGLFFYAGHGVQVKGNNYLIPIDAKLDDANDAEYDCVRTGRILAKMESAGTRTNIVILDACRDNPFERSWNRGSKGSGLAFMNAPSGSLIAYSTSPGMTASDGTGRNGRFTSALLQHIATPNIPILQMFQRVRSTVMNESGNQQTPWESTSLRGNFYFNSERGVVVSKRPTSKFDTKLDAERKQLEQERMELEQLKIEIERKKLEAKRELFETEKKKLSAKKNIPKYASVIKPKVKRDKRFVAYDNGTVKDTKTGLMWASKDNGGAINWKDAGRYCENYRGGGYTDWRMPTHDELAGLYDNSESYQAIQGSYNVHLTELIQLTTEYSWASETRDSFFFGSEAAYFNFTNGARHWNPPSRSSIFRALPVRGGN